MRTIETRSVPITSMHGLTNPGQTWDDLIKSPVAVAIAEDIRRGHGVAQKPRVRIDGRVVFGRNRIAAHAIAGYSDVVCEIVDCTDAELELDECRENLHRKVLDNKARWALARRYRDARSKREKELGGDPRAGAKAAIDEMAARANVSPKTIRNMIAKAAGTAPKPKPRKPPKPPVDLHGAEVSDDWLRATNKARNTIVTAHDQLLTAHRLLDGLRESVPALGKALAGVERAAKELDRQRPAKVCPECWGLIGGCTGCDCLGWVSEAVAGTYSPDAWDWSEEE